MKTEHEYAEYLPPIHLREHVLCLWTQEVRGGVYVHRVVPDGCVDIVAVNDEAAAVVGPWTEAFLVQLAGDTTIAGARFHPGCAAPFLRLPASLLQNIAVPLRDLWGRSRARSFDPVRREPQAAERAALLAHALTASLSEAMPPDDRVLDALRFLRSDLRAPIERMSRYVGLSERQLHRRFASAVGYSAKTFHAILRLQRLLFTARDIEAVPNLADLAVRSGFSDQSHLHREVVRFTALRPRELLLTSGCALELSELMRSGDV